jgi:hypothetical protein
MNKKIYVLWKWDNEVYEVLEEVGHMYRIKNIQYGHTTKADKDAVIVINNM